MANRKLTRRNVLSATAASVALIAPVAAVASNPPGEPLLALEARWLAACAEKKRTYAAWYAIHESLPPHARDSYYPVVPLDGAGGLFLLHHRGKAMSLRDIRRFNEACIYDDQYAWGKSPARLARIRAEGRERVRWWIAGRRDIQRLRDATGLDDANERDEAAYETLAAIEDEIMATPPASIEGVRVKLAVLARMAFIQHSNNLGEPEPASEWEFTDLAVYNLHAEVERITWRAQA